MTTTASAPLALAFAEPRMRDAATLRWSRFLRATAAEGPGLRSALWVQGCSVRCPGCFNPQLWADRGGSVDSTAELAERFVAESLEAGVEGVTLLGGEPFDQASAMATIAERFREAGLTVMTFTGYRLESLREWGGARPEFGRLLDATDLLVDGPYLREQPDTRRPWLGSTNQGLSALTPAYAQTVADIERSGGRDTIEIRIELGGAIEVNGWAGDDELARLLDDLGPRIDRPGQERSTS